MWVLSTLQLPDQQGYKHLKVRWSGVTVKWSCKSKTMVKKNTYTYKIDEKDGDLLTQSLTSHSSCSFANHSPGISFPAHCPSQCFSLTLFPIWIYPLFLTFFRPSFFRLPLSRCTFLFLNKMSVFEGRLSRENGGGGDGDCEKTPGPIYSGKRG